MSQSIQNNENFCILPWVAMQISSDGNIKTCCEQLDSYTQDLSTSLKDIFDGEKSRAMRSDFKKGLVPKACVSCIKRSKYTSTFKTAKHPQWQHLTNDLLERTSNDGTSNFSIKFLDLRFGNLCNFSCRMCESASSSKLKKIDELIGRPSFDLVQLDKNPQLIKNIIQILPDIGEIYFAGGEPLIMEGHYVILDWLVKNKPDIKISYNTNLSTTSYKGRDIRFYWEKIRTIEVYPSIDSIGSRGEYIRHGFDWNKFENNFKFLKNFICGTNTVFNIFNAFSILELIDYMRSVHQVPVSIYPLHTPDNMSVTLLSKTLKQQASERINSYILKNENLYDTTKRHLMLIDKYMLSQDHSFLSKEFKRVNEILDIEYRKDFKKTFPELADWYMSIN